MVKWPVIAVRARAEQEDDDDTLQVQRLRAQVFRTRPVLERLESKLVVAEASSSSCVQYPREKKMPRSRKSGKSVAHDEGGQKGGYGRRAAMAWTSYGEGFYAEGDYSGKGFYAKGSKEKASGGPEGDSRDEVKGSKGKRGVKGKGRKTADQFWKAGFQRSSGDKRTEVMLSRGIRLSEIGRFLNSSNMCRLRRFYQAHDCTYVSGLELELSKTLRVFVGVFVVSRACA